MRILQPDPSDPEKSYSIRDLLLDGVRFGDAQEQCDWFCPVHGKPGEFEEVERKHEVGRCGGIYEHSGGHQCPVCYKPKTDEEIIVDYITRRFDHDN